MYPYTGLREELRVMASVISAEYALRERLVRQ
jgi:hypothetical protein